jgi:hypothetical protein
MMVSAQACRTLTSQALSNASTATLSLGSSLGQRSCSGLLALAVAGQGLVDSLRHSFSTCLGNTCSTSSRAHHGQHSHCYYRGCWLPTVLRAHVMDPASSADVLCWPPTTQPAERPYCPSTGSCTHLLLLPLQLPGQPCWRCHLMQPGKRLQPLPRRTSSSRRQPSPRPGSGPLPCHQWRLPRQKRMRRLHRCHLLEREERKTHGVGGLQQVSTIGLAAAATDKSSPVKHRPEAAAVRSPCMHAHLESVPDMPLLKKPVRPL